MYYTLHCARAKDRVGLMRVLGTLANCENDRAFEDPFLHSLVRFTTAHCSSRNNQLCSQVSLLINNPEEFSAEDYCTVIFDEFFFAGIARENVTRHMLKLLWYIHAKLPTNRLETLVKAVHPTSQVRQNLSSWLTAF
jgi:negative elongation factor B